MELQLSSPWDTLVNRPHHRGSTYINLMYVKKIYIYIHIYVCVCVCVCVCMYMYMCVCVCVCVCVSHIYSYSCNHIVTM